MQSRHRSRLAVLPAALVLLAGCSINPATGKRQFTLYGESSEIAIGRDADPAIRESMGVYDDPALQDYVQRLGASLAATSERPDLPWSFAVVDDPAVNAFALPGGFIYVTRGILAHLDSAAELAGVLGHEIGHVTARHGVNQMSKQQLFGGLLGAGVLVEPGVADYIQPLQTGLSLMFLKFGRDDERQSDELGLRYMQRAGYDPWPMVEVFDVLESVSQAAGGQRLPGWASTHPAPENRAQSIRDDLAGVPRGGIVDRAGYQARLDGLIFGENPREGFFDGPRFLHPEMRFRFDFPDGWKTANTRVAVVGGSTGNDAAIRITLASPETAREAAEQFFRQEGITRGEGWVDDLHGLPAETGYFTAVSGEQRLVGLIAFVEHEGRVLRLLGVTLQDRWSGYRSAFQDSLGSFRRLTDPDVLAVQPTRLRVVTPDAPTTLRHLAEREGSTAGVETLSLINGLDADAAVEAGRPVKIVVGGRLP